MLNVPADKCRAQLVSLFLCGELSDPINIHRSVIGITHSNFLAFIRMQVSHYLHNATGESGAHVAGFWCSRKLV